jgi:hypothetical protein
MASLDLVQLAGRREFLRDSIRYVALTALGLACAVLARGRGAGRSSQTCVNLGVCRGCPAVLRCGLPQALSARRNGKGA